MINLIVLQIFLYIGVWLLASLVIYINKKGKLSIRFKKYCDSNSSLKLLVLLFIIISGIMLIIYLLLFFINYFMIDFKLVTLNFISEDSNNNNNNLSQIFIWWPLSITQTLSILVSAITIYRMVSNNGRLKAIAAIGSIGISIPINIYFHAVENSNDFNRFMYSWIKYKETGKWSSNVPINISENNFYTIFENTVTESVSKYNNINKSSFLPTDMDTFLDKLNFDTLSGYVLNFFRPVPVEGYLDDLIGPQLFLHFLLIIIVIGLILLLRVYIFIQIMVNNKEFILKRFNNRFILFYLKYQLILSKISLFVLPLLIMFGLIELFVILHYIITHPIPFENLPIDLHTYINKK